MSLFTVTCTTCTARLSVRDTAVIGQILECPKCGSMVEIVPPKGWQPPPPAQVKPAPPAPAKTAEVSAPKSATPAAPVSRAPAASGSLSASESQTARPQPPRQADAIPQSAGAPAQRPSTARHEPPRQVSQAEVRPAEPKQTPPKHTDVTHLAAMAEAGLDLEAVASPSLAISPRRSPERGSRNAAPAEQDRAAEDVDHSTVAQPFRRRTIVLIASCVAASALLAAAVGAFLPRARPIESPEPTPIAASRNPLPDAPPADPVVGPKKEKEPPAALPRATCIDPLWLPPGTQAVLSLRLPEILRQDELGQLLRRADPLWRQGLRPLTRGLALPMEDIRRVTWATTNPADMPRASVMVVELSQRLSESDAQRWLTGAAKCDFQFGDVPCHRREQGEWPHPFALVDRQTLVTGPMALMQAIAQAASGAARAAATVCERLLTMVEQDRELVLLADAESLRAANVDLPAAWLADHGELRDYWQAVRALPRGVALQASFAGGLAIEGQALCADEAAADSAQAGLEKLLRTLSSVLASEAETFLKRPDAADIDSAVFTAVSLALSRPKVAHRDHVASFQCSVSTEVTQLAATAWASWKLWEFIHRPAERVDPRVAVNLSGLDRKLPAVEYAQTPLAGFVEDMSRLANVPIAIDLDALAEAGLGQESKVSVKQSDGTVATVLRAAVEPLGLDYTLDPEGLLVTTKNRLRDEPRVVEYDVSDLAGDAAAVAALAELCRRMVEPASWRSPRGTAWIKVASGKLQVQQAGSIHDDLLLLFEKLRVARGRPPQRLPGVKLETRYARVRDRLLKEVTANFSQPTPLPRIADYLSQRAGIKVLIDRVALNKAGIDSADGVVTAEKESLRDVLNKLCDSLEIGWRIVDDKTLEITSRAAASRGEVEFYAVADLLGGESAENLVARVQAGKSSEAWSVAGGPGSLYYDAASRHLIVFQSPAVQLQVEDFLATERAKRNGKTESGAPSKALPLKEAPPK